MRSEDDSVASKIDKIATTLVARTHQNWKISRAVLSILGVLDNNKIYTRGNEDRKRNYYYRRNVLYYYRSLSIIITVISSRLNRTLQILWLSSGYYIRNQPSFGLRSGSYRESYNLSVFFTVILHAVVSKVRFTIHISLYPYLYCSCWSWNTSTIYSQITLLSRRGIDDNKEFTIYYYANKLIGYNYL